jgi:hypothetical protein
MDQRDLAQRRSGQRKSRTEIASLARGYTETVIKVLAGLVTREDVAPAARISAGLALLDRGWGKPTQSVNLHDERPRITEIVNEIIDPANPCKPMEYVIEHLGPGGREQLQLPAPEESGRANEPEPEAEPETS